MTVTVESDDGEKCVLTLSQSGYTKPTEYTACCWCFVAGDNANEVYRNMNGVNVTYYTAEPSNLYGYSASFNMSKTGTSPGTNGGREAAQFIEEWTYNSDDYEYQIQRFQDQADVDIYFSTPPSSLGIRSVEAYISNSASVANIDLGSSTSYSFKVPSSGTLSSGALYLRFYR